MQMFDYCAGARLPVLHIQKAKEGVAGGGHQALRPVPEVVRPCPQSMHRVWWQSVICGMLWSWVERARVLSGLMIHVQEWWVP